MSEGTGANAQRPAKPRALESRPDSTAGSSSCHLAVHGEVHGVRADIHSGQGLDTSIPGVGTQTGPLQAATLPGPHRETLQIILLALHTETAKNLHFHLKQLYVSTKHGERKTVVLILVDGIDFKMNNVTPLYAAAEACCREICHRLIIQALCDEDRPTPLMMEFYQNTHIETAGARSTHRDVEGMCFHLAAKSGHYNIVENLLCGLICQEENFCVDGSVFSDMDARCNLQAVTVPLPIAAPEDRLESVIMLSSDINPQNGEGETPPGYTVWWVVWQADRREREARSLTFPKNAERLLHRDISRGQERVPVPCVNTVDGDGYPDDYEYIPECCVASPISIDRDITHLQNCVCEENCSASICLYDEEISLQCWYDEEGRLLPQFYLEDPPFVFECNQACCGRGCQNRVVQHGLRTRLQLFKTNKKGWGVQALEDIPQWTFVCQYAGEIISETEALMREDDTYILSLDCHRDQLEESYCVDSLFCGNISRFFNHMCEANLFPCRVFTTHQDLRFPSIAFFTCTNVKAGDELGFDYGDAYWQDKGRYFSCECGSPKCKHSATAMMTQLQADNTPEE